MLHASRKTWNLVLLVALFVLAACSKPYRFTAIVHDPPFAIDNFVLTGDDGTQFNLADLQGRYMLLTFGYTSCPDTCPATLAMLRLVREKLDAQGRQMAVVFVSVDPQRDSSQLVRHYVSLFAEDFIGVTGTPNELEQAVKVFNTKYQINKEKVYLSSGYDVAHSAYVYVIDPNFHLRLEIPYGEQINEMVNDLQTLMTMDLEDADSRSQR